MTKIHGSWNMINKPLRVDLNGGYMGKIYTLCFNITGD